MNGRTVKVTYLADGEMLKIMREVEVLGEDPATWLTAALESEPVRAYVRSYLLRQLRWGEEAERARKRSA